MRLEKELFQILLINYVDLKFHVRLDTFRDLLLCFYVCITFSNFYILCNENFNDEMIIIYELNVKFDTIYKKANSTVTLKDP